METHHIEKLLANYLLGILIEFENNLSLWQQLHDDEQLPKIACNINMPTTNAAMNNNLHLIQVDHLLSNSLDGSLIVNYFKTHGELNDSIRRKLVDLVIHNLMANAIPMSITLADNIANPTYLCFHRN